MFKKYVFSSRLICSVSAMLLSLHVNAQLPSISSFTPGSGPAGTLITINGANMSDVPAENVVYFGAVRATVQSATSSQLTVSSPVGATYGPITVSVNGKTAYSSKFFLPSFQNQAGNADLFEPASKVNTGNNPQFVFIADIDVDGKPDMIVCNTNDETISIFRNISTTGSLTENSFAPKVEFETNRLPWAVAFGDLNGDSKPDIAVACGGGPNVVYRNVSSPGSLTLSSLEFDGEFGGGGGGSIVIDDLDGDGNPDVIATNYGRDSIEVYRNSSIVDSIFFDKKVSFLTDGHPSKLVVGDLNSDGKKDLAVCARNANTVCVYRNVTTPGVITTSSFDAKVDFITGNIPNSYPGSLAIGDLDGDGLLDLAVANVNGVGLSILKGTGNTGPITSSTFNAKVDIGVVSSPMDVCLADMDGDKKLDVVINNYTDKMNIYRNIGNTGSISGGSFAAAIELTVGDEARSIAVGDLDGDDKPDIATTHVSPEGLSLFRNSNGIVTGTESEIESVAVFPTLVDNTLTIDGLQSDSFELLISDMSGRTIHSGYQYANTNLYNIDVTDLAPGQYFLKTSACRKVFRFVKK